MARASNGVPAPRRSKILWTLMLALGSGLLPSSVSAAVDEPIEVSQWTVRADNPLAIRGYGVYDSRHNRAAELTMVCEAGEAAKTDTLVDTKTGETFSWAGDGKAARIQLSIRFADPSVMNTTVRILDQVDIGAGNLIVGIIRIFRGEPQMASRKPQSYVIIKEILDGQVGTEPRRG